MYSRFITLLLILFQLCFQHKAQVSFTLPPSTCINSILVLSANTGSLPSPQINWLTTPNAQLSNSLSANTAITFTSAGSYSILLVVTSGTNLSFAQNTIQVYANPSPTLYAFPTSVCPSGNLTLTSFLPPIGLPSYTFLLPGNSPVITGSVPTLPTVAPSSSALPAVYSISVEVAGCSGMASTSVQELSLHPVISAVPNQICVGFSSTLVAYPNTLSTYTFSVLSPSPVSFPNGSSPTIAVSPTQTTLYQVIVDSANCTGSATLNLNISPPLNISLSATSLTTCLMSNSPKLSKLVTLNASGAATYTWLPYDSFNPCTFNCAQYFVRPQVNTCYTVTGSTAVCSGSAAICVTVIPQFTFAVSPASASICLGQSLTLLTGNVGAGAFGSPSAYLYSWTEASNAPPISMSSNITPTNQVFPHNSTTYTVQIADSLYCISIPQVATIEVLSCTNVKEIMNNRILEFFPNPVTTDCKLQNRSTEFLSFVITELSGKIIVQQSLSPEQSIDLDLRALASGCYLLLVQTPEGAIIPNRLLKSD